MDDSERQHAEPQQPDGGLCRDEEVVVKTAQRTWMIHHSDSRFWEVSHGLCPYSLLFCFGRHASMRGFEFLLSVKEVLAKARRYGWNT